LNPFKFLLQSPETRRTLIFEHVQLDKEETPVNSLVAYYVLYLGSCAGLIAWLSWTFHRSGSVFLREAFRGDQALVRSVTHLLDIGFYLVSLGYVALTWKPWGWPPDSGPSIEMIVAKLGFFLLFMGALHLFNTFLLAVFRRRTLVANPAQAAGNAQ
jgi:hypothetical protein